MSIEEIIKILNEFVPFAEDDPVNDNETFFYKLMDAWQNTQDKEKAIPFIFQLMEKYPQADFGSPGPLVHSLETTGIKGYEGELHKSLMRKPTSLTLWMYNRLINAENDDRIIRGHIQRLKLFAKHPVVDPEAKEQAEHFVKYQEKRL